MHKTIMLYFILLSSTAFCETINLDKTRESAQDKFESGFMKTAIGSIELGLGVLSATRGEITVAAGATAAGIATIKQGISDFKEAKELFERVRDVELRAELNEINFGVFDREY